MPTPTVEPPKGLRAWGRQLWEKVTESTGFDHAGYYILAEACRTADIIERLSGMLNSNSTEWVQISEDAVQYAMVEGENVATVNLVVNPIMGEIRQQRMAFRTLMAQLKLGQAEAATEDDDPIAKLMADFASSTD